MLDAVSQCADLIEKSRNIAALTGAGISTSAGIPDFRGPQGLYVTRQYDPDTVFDIDYFREDPKPFFDFARDFLTLAGDIRPTPTHLFLSQLEACGKLKGIITQNIDSLHQMAGSKNVYEMHGSFGISFCLMCGKGFSFADMKKKLSTEEVPHCPCGGVVKPNVVFFGEDVKYLIESEDLAAKADLFLVIGTSCVVYPAAAIPTYVSGKIVVVNQDRVTIPSEHVVLRVRENIDAFFTQVAQRLNFLL